MLAKFSRWRLWCWGLRLRTNDTKFNSAGTGLRLLSRVAWLAAAALGDAMTSVSVGMSQERSSLICTSPPRYRHSTTQLFRGDMDQVPVSIATVTPMFTHSTGQDVSSDSASCLAAPTLESSLPPRDPRSLLESVSFPRQERTPCLTPPALLAQASASAAVSSAQGSASSALPTADHLATYEKQTEDEEMSKQISVPMAIIAIVSTAAGTCMLSLLGYYLFLRRHKAKQRAHDEEKEVNAALDRAIVSYIAKEPPSLHGSSAPAGPRQSEPAMTTAVNAKKSSAEDDWFLNSHQPHHEPPAPTLDRRRSLRRSDTSTTDISRRLRRTASSHFMDSAEQVYADILARPLEHDRTQPLSRPAEPAPAARDDVGWPLASKVTSKESWL